MKKIIFIYLVVIMSIYGAPIKDENSSIEADQLIKELKNKPIAIKLKKKKVNLNKKRISSIKKDIDADLINIDNINIDIKTIISDGFLSARDEKETLTKLKAIEINDFSEKYLEDLSVLKESKTKDELILSIKELKKRITKTKNIQESIIKKYEFKIEQKESLISQTPINKYLVLINNKFSEVNPILLNIGLDIGRVIVFIISILFFIFIGYFTNLLLKLLFAKLSKVTDEDELENNNFDSIKKPMLFLSFLLGFQIGVEILIYPNPLPVFITLFFITINTINIIIISNKFIDILFFIASHKNIIKIKRAEIINLFTRGIKLLILLIGIIYLLSIFGVNTTKIVASLGIGGVAIAFASKDFISKFFSGLKLIIDDSFSSGDWVLFNCNQKEGTILDIGFINTRVRTFDNALLVIPNSKITEDSYINWSRRKIGRKLGFTIGLKYSSDKKDIKNVLVELRNMLENHELISKNNVDFSKKRVRNGKFVSIGDDIGLKNTLMVHLSKFGDSAIEIDIYAFSRSVVWSEWRETREVIMFEIMDILEKNNLELAFPSQSIYIEKEEN